MASRLVIPPTAFATTSRRLKRERVTSESHRKFIGSLPCLVTGLEGETQCAHISYAAPAYGKLGRGYGTKEDDIWTVPLSREEHDRQHSMNEVQYWMDLDLDPCVVAMALYIHSGDYERAETILRLARER